MTIREVELLISNYESFLKEYRHKLSEEDIERIRQEIKYWERLLQIVTLISTGEYNLHKSKSRNQYSYKPLLNGMDYKIVKTLKYIIIPKN